MSRLQPATELKLTLLIGAWKLRPDTYTRSTESIENYIRIAQAAERVGLHGIFLADALNFDALVSPSNRFDPTILSAVLAAVTERIHFVTTVSTTFHHPTSVARYISSIAHASDDRIGINLVTSFGGERNFSADPLPEPETRYRRLIEFDQVLRGLWGADVEAPESEQRIDFRGEFFSVDGPLSTRPPERRPGVGQAGSSPLGIDVAARTADFVFTAQPTESGAAVYAERLRALAEEYRTDGTRPTILTGATTIIADTHDEAVELEREINAGLDIARAREKLEHTLGGADLSGIELHERVPAELLPDTSGITRRQGRAAIFRSLIVDERLTLREVLDHLGKNNGHLTLVGTAGEVAEGLIRRAEQGTTDGFTLTPADNGDAVDAVVDGLVPELQERGYFTPHTERGTSFVDTFRTTVAEPAHR